MTPLVDLHRHLEGSIRPDTSIELATRAGSGLLPAQWRAALVAAEREEGLLPYLAKIENATALVRTLDDWRRVTAEALADACSDGLAALELRFSPQFIAGMTALDPDDIIETVGDAVSGAGLPIEVGLIGIIVRDEGPDSALVQVRRLLRHMDALAAVDLAGNEAGYPAELFAPAFRLAHESGLPVTIHAGEAAGPHSVWDALRLAPRRIGHGVRSAEDPRLLDHLASCGVTLEVAITSNVQTGAALSRAQHQLATLVAAGVRVALCTDNPAVSDTCLSREYELAGDLVDASTLDRIRENALAARFTSPRSRSGGVAAMRQPTSRLTPPPGTPTQLGNPFGKSRLQP
jgi:adenosine deaminase